MRASAVKSAADSPVAGFERYPKGSIVLCNACSKPIAKLDGGIALGDKAGRMAQQFKPLSLSDLQTLAAREDIDAGIRALVRGWTVAESKAHVAALCEFRAGDPMLCPCCHDCFVQVLGVEKDEVLDKAYTIELLTIPPSGTPPPVRGKRISATGDWVH